jgi:hypothetical protein
MTIFNKVKQRLPLGALLFSDNVFQAQSKLKMKQVDFRVVTTLIVMFFLKLNKFPLVYAVVALFLLDQADCMYVKANQCSGNFTYQYKDKLCDLFAYLIFFVLYRNEFPTFFQTLFILLMVYRTIGVIRYIETKDENVLIYYFDGMNAILVAHVLTIYIPSLQKMYKPFLFFFVSLKIVYEWFHHGS